MEEYGIRQDICPLFYNMLLMPLGVYFNTAVKDAPNGSILFLIGTEKKFRKLRSCEIPFKNRITKKYSQLAETLCLSIYGYTAETVWEVMSDSWGIHIEDEYMLLLVVEPCNKSI